MCVLGICIAIIESALQLFLTIEMSNFVLVTIVVLITRNAVVGLQEAEHEMLFGTGQFSNVTWVR